MSVLGTDEQDNIYYNIMDFLENHKVSELMEIIQYCIQSDENRKEGS